MENEPLINEEIAQNSPALDSTEKQRSKSKNSSKIAMIILAVLATAGLGFGVYEYLQNGDKSAKIAELTAKLDLIKTETGTELVEKVEDGVERTYVEPTTTTETVATKDYIYIGEWGIKIKIPETLKNINYTYNRHINDTDNYGGSFYVSARLKDDPVDVTDGSADFGDMYFNSGLAAIGIYPDPNQCSNAWEAPDTKCEITVVSSEGNTLGIRVSGSQTAYSADESQREWESKARTAIIQFLSDPSNYSAI